MKQLSILIFAALCIVLSACAQKKESNVSDNKSQVKVAVTYFSATGTTKAVAEQIAQATGGTLLEITPTELYTDADLDWTDDNSRSTLEMKDESSRPACKAIDVSDYNVVYVGYPIWWNLAPRIINTFIESQDLKGKKIIPFATSGGSTITNSVKMLKQTYPDLNWADGKLLNGVSQSEIEKWVNEQ